MATSEQADTPRHKAMNKWTREQRVALHLLHERRPALTSLQRQAIFNTIFAHDLRQCGLPDGLTLGRLLAQYNESAKQYLPRCVAVWRPILNGPQTPEETKERDAVRAEIERVVRVLSGEGTGSHPAAATPAASLRQMQSTSSIRPNCGSGNATLKSQHCNAAAVTQGTEEPLVSKQPFIASPPDSSDARPRELIDLMELSDDDAQPETLSTQQSRRQRAAHQSSEWASDTSRNAVRSSAPFEHAAFVPARWLKSKKRGRTSPEVVLPITPKRRRTAELEVVPSPRPTQVHTPRKTPSSLALRQAKATEDWNLPQGTIRLTQAELAVAKEPLLPPSEIEVHPPLAGLLFRYWTDDCFSKLEHDEFVADYFARFSAFGNEPPPLPRLEDFQYFWNDVAAHMNRVARPSPWISTCNNLLWIIRLAVQESKKGVTSGKITVINAHALNREAVFHAQPLHRELRKKRPFTDGAFRYQGMREFIIYHKIPRAAILHTFNVAELLRFAVSKPSVGDLLRLHKLSKAQVSMQTLMQTLKEHDIGLNTQTVSAAADVVRVLGLSSTAATDHIMHIVSDIVQGWCLIVTYYPPEQWSELADVFASTLVSPRSTGWMKDYQRMKMAFLDGIRWSQGEVNTRHKPERMQKMLRKARKLGLDNPAKILSDEMDAAKLGVMMYDQKQQQLLSGTPSRQHVLEAATEAEDEEEEVESPTLFTAHERRRGGQHGLAVASRHHAVFDDDDIQYDTNEE